MTLNNLKLQNSPPKSITLLGNLLDLHEQWRRVLPRATATGGAWKGRKTGGSGSASFPFPVLTGVTCKKQKKGTQQSILLCFLLFRSVSVFSFSDLLHRRSFFGFTSSSPSLQVGVLLVWDGVCGGGARGGRRCCTESEPSLLVEEGGQLWRMRKGLWRLC